MDVRALLLLTLTGCTLVTDSFLTNDFSGDPFPIEVETHSGAIVLGMSQDSGSTQIAVLDLMSPMTVTDPGSGIAPSVGFSQLQLLGEQSRSGNFTVPRAQLKDAQVLSLHPCSDDAVECDIGPGGAPRPFEAIIGADGLAGDAVRLNLATDEIYILADVAGTDAERTYACDAVFDSPYRGGGTLVLAGTELPFGSRRVAIDACLAPNPIASVPQSQRGADVLLVASTAVGPSLISETAYERYRQAQLGAPPALETLADDTVFLPSGLVTGKRATLPGLALVGNSSSNPRAPCRQVWAHHLMTERNCVEGDDCPCPGDFSSNPFCGVPSILELAPSGGISILVLPDTDPTLQALRAELHPDQPEVDGILGLDAMRLAQIDIDYPHDRVLARCNSARCSTRPQLANEDSRTQIRLCLGEQPLP